MTTNRRPALRTVTVHDESFTVMAMHPTDIADLTEDMDLSGMPEDTTGLQGPKGWNIFDANGEHIGRIYGRSTILCAEWFDDAEGDWMHAKWNCKRVERGIAEILILRDEKIRQYAARSRKSAEERGLYEPV